MSAGEGLQEETKGSGGDNLSLDNHSHGDTEGINKSEEVRMRMNIVREHFKELSNQFYVLQLQASKDDPLVIMDLELLNTEILRLFCSKHLFCRSKHGPWLLDQSPKSTL